MPDNHPKKMSFVACELVLDMAAIKPPATRKALAFVHCDGLTLSASAHKAGITRQNLNTPAKKFALVKMLADLYSQEINENCK